MYLGGNNQRVRRHYDRRDKDDEFDQVHEQQHVLFRHPKPGSGFDPRSHVTHDHHPASAGSLRRHIAASLMRHHQSAERNKHALQPLSPASYGSSLEIAPYNPAATPDSSIELRGRIGDSSYSFKTSTELLKVLNRIWTLEEQHASNVSLVKGLKTELDHARSKIKSLLQDRQANRHEIDQLMKKISGDNLSRRTKDHERIDAALQSVRDELENERKLRKRSESLHRKLARELFEVKVALSTTVKEYEKEKQSSELIEELCDKFAHGVREYARQVQTTKQKTDVDWTGMTELDNLILHMSESWLDERSQMKDEKTHPQPTVEKLKTEIESFLASPRDPNGARLRRRSLESIPEIITAHEDSAFSDPISMKTGEETRPTEINMLQKSDIYDCAKEQRQKTAYDEQGNGSNSKTVDKLISELLISEGGNLPANHEYKELTPVNTGIKRNASPVRQWMTGMATRDPRTPEPSSKIQAVEDSSLKAKLQEPKTRGQRSRLKILKGSS